MQSTTTPWPVQASCANGAQHIAHVRQHFWHDAAVLMPQHLHKPLVSCFCTRREGVEFGCGQTPDPSQDSPNLGLAGNSAGADPSRTIGLAGAYPRQGCKCALAPVPALDTVCSSATWDCTLKLLPPIRTWILGIARAGSAR